MRQAVIYTRFSPRPNAGDCQSCEFQEQKAREYCEYQGLDVLDVFRDKAASGKSATEKARPGLNKALTLVTRHRAILVCYNMARLSRSVKDLCAIVDRLQKRSANLVLVTDQIDTTTPMGRFFLHLMACVAQLERETTGEHTRAVLLAKQKNGYLVSRAPPFGFKLAPECDWELHPETGKKIRKIILDHEEQETIALVRRLHRERYSLQAICYELIRLGRKPRGKTWHRTSIKRILNKKE
jgi:site-specific DNA recombinase